MVLFFLLLNMPGIGLVGETGKAMEANGFDNSTDFSLDFINSAFYVIIDNTT